MWYEECGVRKLGVPSKLLMVSEICLAADLCASTLLEQWNKQRAVNDTSGKRVCTIVIPS